MLARIERLASHLHPYRWHFGVASVLCVCVLLAIMQGQLMVWPALFVAGPALMWTWGFFCTAFWFSAQGTLSAHGQFAQLAPRTLVTAVRWYAAVVLVLWLAAAIFFTFRAAIVLFGTR